VGIWRAGCEHIAEKTGRFRCHGSIADLELAVARPPS
jgi:hypothetical protein